jgi:F-type H+-transporting ATPase subunit alpha
MSSVAEEILKKIEQEIQTTNLAESLSKKGQILEVKDWVALVSGMDQAMFSEIVQFESGTKGLVLDLLSDKIWVLILGNQTGLEQGQIVKSTGKVFSIWVGQNYIGRVLNGLGEPIDDMGDIQPEEYYPVEKVAPWVIARQSVNQPLETGIKAIDSMIPIGRWQRELIIWDRQTGKTTIAIDTILNQKGQNITCIYVAIGQKESKVRRIVQTLKEKWAMEYTIVVSAPANNPAVMQYIAPYTGTALGEYFMFNGQDALIIYDDLSKHAVAYREVSLLLRRPPGREAYPGDIFYLHSRLLERASRISMEYVEKTSGGKVKNKTWSLTALPIIETQASDVSAYIPTNVISITDGQIFLETDLFNAGIKPAINVGLSVSRVWWNAQTKIMKKVAGKLRLELASFRELQAFAQFASDLDDATLNKIERWRRLVEMLKQWGNNPIWFAKQSVLIYAGINGYFDQIKVEQISQFESILYDKLESSYKGLYDKISSEKTLSEEIESDIKKLLIEVQEEVKWS